MRKTGLVGGNFRFALGGKARLQATFRANKALLSGAAGLYDLVVDELPKEIVLRTNSLSSEWIDLQESIQSGRIRVQLPDGADDDGKELLKQLKKEGTKANQNGAALRWAVSADQDMTVELVLQCLPLSAETIR